MHIILNKMVQVMLLYVFVLFAFESSGVRPFAPKLGRGQIIYLSPSLSLYIYIYIYIHTYIYVYMYICMYVIYIYIYVLHV